MTIVDRRGLAAAAVAVAALAVAAWPATARAEGRLRLDLGGTFSRFEQQVKTEVGGAKGEILVEDTEVGLLDTLTYDVWGPLSAGVFVQLDAGNREAGRFAGFDGADRTLVTGQVGGSYTELWMGPVVRAEWRRLFFEIGYGLYGARHDEARDDLPSEANDTSSSLRTHPTIAWLFGLGGVVPITDELGVALRLQYRVRYYNRRGGDDLAGDVVHGTQNVTPFVGIAWRVGPERD